MPESVSNPPDTIDWLDGSTEIELSARWLAGRERERDFDDRSRLDGQRTPDGDAGAVDVLGRRGDHGDGLTGRVEHAHVHRQRVAESIIAALLA